MKVLIAGGAGYIGGTIASACLDAGVTPILLDRSWGPSFDGSLNRIGYEGDIADNNIIDGIFRDHPDIEVAILCAALTKVPDSVLDPIAYYDTNVSKSLRFLIRIQQNGCRRLIFSSSTAIFQSDTSVGITEKSPLNPESPYTRSKLAFEWILEDLSRSSGFRAMSLRFANPIGADPKLRTGLKSSYSSHVLGKLLVAMETNTPLEITGSDFPTRDGTGIRDYVHVWDIAEAHVAALRIFMTDVDDGRRFEAINLGSGCGTTVLELLATFNQTLGTHVTYVLSPPRLGDTAGIFVNIEKAFEVLKWKPLLTLEEGIRDSLRWFEIWRERYGQSRDSGV
jgi:UDP-glucose 4-epimerase